MFNLFQILKFILVLNYPIRFILLFRLISIESGCHYYYYSDFNFDKDLDLLIF
jgi:hypothetical protein